MFLFAKINIHPIFIIIYDFTKKTPMIMKNNKEIYFITLLYSTRVCMRQLLID